MHAGLGVAASFVPGMQWYVPVAASAGLSALGGGDLEDQIYAGTMGGLGYGLGSLGQSAYQGTAGMFGGGSKTVTVTSIPVEQGGAMASAAPVNPAPITESLAVPPNMGSATYAPVTPGVTGMNLPPPPPAGGSVAVAMPTTAGGYETVVAPVTGEGAGLGQALGVAPTAMAAPVQESQRVAPRAAATPAQATTVAAQAAGAGLSMPKVPGGVGTILALKGGLGFLQNYQAQQAVEDELKRRDEMMDWIARAEQNPGLIYQQDPGLLAMRKQYLDDVAARYRAKYGGTEGGAFAKSLMRESAKIDSMLLDQAIRRKYGMLSATQPAVGYNLQAGGTPVGAAAQAGQQMLTDWAFLEFLRGIQGGQ